MNAHEVPNPNWHFSEHDQPEQRSGRRIAMDFYLPPRRETSNEGANTETAIKLKLVHRIRASSPSEGLEPPVLLVRNLEFRSWPNLPAP